MSSYNLENVQRQIESITRSIKETKSRIVDLDPTDMSRFATYSVSVAECAGMLKAYQLLEDSLNQGQEIDRAFNRLLGYALVDEDNYSGRTNDLQRAFSSKFREVVRDFRFLTIK